MRNFFALFVFLLSFTALLNAQHFTGTVHYSMDVNTDELQLPGGENPAQAQMMKSMMAQMMPTGMTHHVGKTQMRTDVEMNNPMMPGGTSTLVRQENGSTVVYTLMHAAKTALRDNPEAESIGTQAGENMSMADVSALIRKHTTVNSTGKQKTILGYPVQEYDVDIDGDGLKKDLKELEKAGKLGPEEKEELQQLGKMEMEMSYWASERLQINPDLMGYMQLGAPSAGKGGQNNGALSELIQGGLPLEVFITMKVPMEMAGKISIHMVADELEKGEPDAAQFEIPAGYRVTENPVGGPGAPPAQLPGQR